MANFQRSLILQINHLHILIRIHITTIAQMSRPSKQTHWLNTQGDDLDFPVDDELLQALKHRPEPGKDISNLTFDQYLNEMDKEDPRAARKLFSRFDRFKLHKLQQDVKKTILANNEFNMAQKIEVMATVQSLFPRKGVPMNKITDEVADLVREMAQTTGNISQIARACTITPGSVKKILKRQARQTQ